MHVGADPWAEAFDIIGAGIRITSAPRIVKSDGFPILEHTGTDPWAEAFAPIEVRIRITSAIPNSRSNSDTKGQTPIRAIKFL